VTFGLRNSWSSYDAASSHYIFFFDVQMVRVLVATAIREAAAGAGADALLNLMEATDRRATAPPAPPEGLCLVDVGYEDFDKQRCFIVD
jgi:tRNA U38,U39,U40 pseudouridine synthase TruA